MFDLGYSTSDSGPGLGLVQQVADANGWSPRIVEGSAGGRRVEITDVDFKQ